jgi:crooked neck
MFEQQLGEIDKARAIFGIGTSDVELDLPELLWKAYIDFEIGQKQMDKARDLFEKLLE